MQDETLNLNPEDYSLLTDLYQLTMAACYVGEGIDQRQASFEMFVRHLPDGFGYLIAMGLAQVLEYLEQLRFTPAQIEALQATGIFVNAPAEFWSLLAEARFTGDVWAVPEGTAVFAHEPLLRVEAPLWQAQIVETYLLNVLNYQSLIATRAARLRDVAGSEAMLLEFGTRRAFSPQASLWAARAALAAGLDATSNVLAALKLGCQPSGTMAHSLVMALTAIRGSEDQAFTAFHRYFPGAPLLIDTYDSVAAAGRLAKRVEAGEIELSGVRLDSGDLVELSKRVRSLLPNVTIFASGDLDEHEILRLKEAGAIIDGYGLGTKLVTGAPANGVYKLVEIDGIPVMKESSGKVTYPGRKQIFRRLEPGTESGFGGDRLGLATEPALNGEQPLMQLVVKQGQRVQGQRVQPVERLEAITPEGELLRIAQRTLTTVNSLPATVRQIEQPRPVNPEISTALQELTQRTQQNIRKSYTEQNSTE